ncbi:uncharacterized protein EDB93DRAFT_1249526 [Suillus bovinus]|uniref:uncharacterized protein n=1 Tax=Suillus bovinus TaxID=48563 RepID=UPI001B86918B|nr:uncharacterized protein EDB93DRAFT_1249526 [Suillus bovinus]KAG2151030.1 hypothetical protein EDB93DRAFT_1249526 [Suillus bovinus]
MLSNLKYFAILAAFAPAFAAPVTGGVADVVSVDNNVALNSKRGSSYSYDQLESIVSNVAGNTGVSFPNNKRSDAGHSAAVDTVLEELNDKLLARAKYSEYSLSEITNALATVLADS